MARYSYRALTSGKKQIAAAARDCEIADFMTTTSEASAAPGFVRLFRHRAGRADRSRSERHGWRIRLAALRVRPQRARRGRRELREVDALCGFHGFDRGCGRHVALASRAEKNLSSASAMMRSLSSDSWKAKSKPTSVLMAVRRAFVKRQLDALLSRRVSRRAADGGRPRFRRSRLA